MPLKRKGIPANSRRRLPRPLVAIWSARLDRGVFDTQRLSKKIKRNRGLRGSSGAHQTSRRLERFNTGLHRAESPSEARRCLAMQAQAHSLMKDAHHRDGSFLVAVDDDVRDWSWARAVLLLCK